LVIVGGEGGPNARPCNVEWIRSIVRQCAETGVPCFVKQDSGVREEIERLRDAVAYLRENAVQTHGSDPYVYVWQRAWQEFQRRVDENGFCSDRPAG
jgi:hypothetical protein